MASATRKLKTEGGHDVTLSLITVGDEPPAEFLIFKAGMNTTSKGDFLFDAKAAADVMAAFQKHGADVMIDLEHLSIDDEGANYDPDARGWCRLEVRAGGDLWASNVTWTPDGGVRLREKRQRYVSPAFSFNTKTRRIDEIVNIAITALPATDKPAALVAAARRHTKLSTYEGESPMTPEEFTKLAEALGLGPDAKVEDVFAQLAAMMKKITDATNGTPPAEDAAAAASDAPKPEDPPVVVAAKRLSTGVRKLSRLAGKAEIGEVVAEIETWRQSHLDAEKERGRVAQERLTLEGSERRKLVATLVTIGGETPATAWAKDAEGIPDGKTPCKRLADEPLTELRTRVDMLSKGKTKQKDPVPPAGDDASGLTPEQMKICKDTGCDPATFAALRKSTPAITVRS